MKILIKPIIFLVIMLTTVACDRDKKSLLWPANFTCKINGISYKDHTPFLLPPGAKRYPVLSYSYSEDQKRLFFYSLPALVNKGEAAVGSYTLIIYIPLQSPLQLKKEYMFEGIAGENHRMPFNYLSNYLKRGLPYCNVYASGDMNVNSFGTGKLIVSSLDEDKTTVKGSIEFSVPSPASEDSTHILIFKGDFETSFNLD